MENIVEISQFLNFSARSDLKTIALEYVLGLTSSFDGIKLICTCEDVLNKLIILAGKKDRFSKAAYLTLVNITAEDIGVQALMKIEYDESTKDTNALFINDLINTVINKNTEFADTCCMILCNISRGEKHLDYFVSIIHPYLQQIVNAFSDLNYNEHGANLHYLGPLLSNLTANINVQQWFCDEKSNDERISSILPFCSFRDSAVRRKGAVGAIRNLCFDTENHQYLLNLKMNILTYLLLPLAGSEEFDDDEMNCLPISLQYLPSDKKREDDPNIRKMLLESLNKLCTKKFGRQFLRDNGTYYILRELHKWEKDRNVLLVCENVVDILIRKEEEIEIEDISVVDVPKEYCEKFIKMDDDFVKDI